MRVKLWRKTKTGETKVKTEREGRNVSSLLKSQKLAQESESQGRSQLTPCPTTGFFQFD